MKRKIAAGITSHIEHIAIDDNTATDGSGLTGLAYNSASLACKYKRTGDATWTTVSLVTATAGTYTSGGFVESDSGAGGEYEFHTPNAVLAAGAVGAVVVLYGAANMAPVRIEYELDAIPYQTTPNTSGGILVGGTLVSLDALDTALDLRHDTTQAAIADLTGDIYSARVDVSVSDTDGSDVYTIIWEKNGVAQTTGVTVPTIQVVKRDDGTDLIASSTPTEIGSTGFFSHEESTNRLGRSGEQYIVIVTATIDSDTRTDIAIIGRDG